MEKDRDDYLDRPGEKEGLLHTTKEETDILRQQNEGRPTVLVTSCAGTAFSDTLLKKRQNKGVNKRDAQFL